MLLDLKQLVEKYGLQINGVIHVGAHYGQEIPLYRELKINQMIFFEPDPQTFSVLLTNVGEDTKCICMNTALGNMTGEIDFNVASNEGGSSSILKPVLHLQQYPRIAFDKKIKVHIDKLDNVISKLTIKYNFLNMDVQGYELEVLKGAIKTLDYIDYIITEVNRDEVYQDCARVTEMDKFLSNWNFVRQETTWDGNTWGDAFYIKIKKN